MDVKSEIQHRLNHVTTSLRYCSKFSALCDAPLTEILAASRRSRARHCQYIDLLF